jgi:hypothetical protein
MFRINYRVLQVGTFAVFAILFCVRLLGDTSQSQAKQDSSGGLFFDLTPASNEVPYACLGKPIQGWFIVGTESKPPSLPDPLAPLVLFQIQVWTTPPLVGTLSKDSWTIQSTYASKRFTYTPTKTGDENFSFNAWILDSPDSPLVKNIELTVINCRFRISIHGEFHNMQGSINADIFYDGEGYLDLVQNDKDSGWSIMGYGTTTLTEYVDGTEGDVTCSTSAPGQGSGEFWVDGEAEPSARLNPVFRFTDILTSVGQTCTDKGKGKTMANTIRSTGWLPNSNGNGVLGDLEFSPQGDNQELPISAVNDFRWTQGSNTGSMTITITPETNK